MNKLLRDVSSVEDHEISVTPGPEKHYPLLFEMLRSFAMLAETLNLSKAVLNLGSTRQTVRRHISLLEDIKGGSLFTIHDRQYALTDLGAKVLPETLDLLAQVKAWMQGRAELVNGLQYLSSEEENGWFYYQQQHSINMLSKSSSPLLQDIFIGWAQSAGKLEHDAMVALRPYVTVFRKVGGQWLFTEVGEKSAFAAWFGWTYARSAIGRLMQQLPLGADLERLMHSAYHEVEINGCARLDHIHTVIPRADEETPTAVSYERLLLAARFPDDSFAMMSATRPTYDIEIKGVTEEMLQRMPKKFLM